jgi:hypothetical protein
MNEVVFLDESETSPSGGSAFDVTSAISDTPDDPLWQQMRVYGGDMTFAIPVPTANTDYRVTFYTTAHPGYSPRQHILLEDGSETIYSVKPRAGIVKEHQATVRVSDGLLNVRIVPKNDSGSWLSAMRIEQLE